MGGRHKFDRPSVPTRLDDTCILDSLFREEGLYDRRLDFTRRDLELDAFLTKCRLRFDGEGDGDGVMRSNLGPLVAPKIELGR